MQPAAALRHPQVCRIGRGRDSHGTVESDALWQTHHLPHLAWHEVVGEVQVLRPSLQPQVGSQPIRRREVLHPSRRGQVEVAVHAEVDILKRGPLQVARQLALHRDARLRQRPHHVGGQGSQEGPQVAEGRMARQSRQHLSWVAVGEGVHVHAERPLQVGLRHGEVEVLQGEARAVGVESSLERVYAHSALLCEMGRADAQVDGIGGIAKRVDAEMQVAEADMGGVETPFGAGHEVLVVGQSAIVPVERPYLVCVVFQLENRPPRRGLAEVGLHAHRVARQV